MIWTGRQTDGGIHDPALYIHDGLGRYVLTNARFLSDWVSGAWEKVASSAVPSDFRFTVEVPEIPFDGSGGFWTAVQKNQRIELISSAATPCRPQITVDAIYSGARIQVCRHHPIPSDDPQYGTWGAVQDVSVNLACQRSRDRCIFELPEGFTLGRKDLLIVELQRRPSIPANLRTSGAAFSDTFTVLWNAATPPSAGDMLRYELQSSLDASFTSPTTYHAGPATSRRLTGQPDGTSYYRVRACTAVVCGDYSAVISRAVQLQPTAPTILRATIFPTGSILLSWEGATGYITGYELQESRDPSFTTGTAIPVRGAHPSYLYTPSSGSYYYRVRAVNDRGRRSSHTVLENNSGAPLAVIV